MKSRLLGIILCLPLGAAANVAVAWGASWFGVHPQSLADSERGFTSWPTMVPSYWPMPERTMVTSDRLWSITRLIASWHDEEEGTMPSLSCALMFQRTDFGWPWRSLRSERWDEFLVEVKAQAVTQFTNEDLMMPGWRAGWATESGFKYLPLLPVWPGFAINTLFYAGVLWVLFAGPFALRRMIRRRRGQCARCAYPIGANNVCTECGAAVTRISG